MGTIIFETSLFSVNLVFLLPKVLVCVFQARKLVLLCKITRNVVSMQMDIVKQLEDVVILVVSVYEEEISNPRAEK